MAPGLQGPPQGLPFPQAPGQPFPGQSYTVYPPQQPLPAFPSPYQPQGQSPPQFPGPAQFQIPPQFPGPTQFQVPPQFPGPAQFQAPPPFQTAGPFQAQPGPQPQTAQVAPVAFPTSPYGAQAPQGQGQGQAPPSPAQVLAKQLMDIARLLEQLIPGYQMAQSVLMDLAAPGQTVSGLDDASRGVKDVLYYHGATLGAIRRLLLGETTPAVLTGLAAAVQALTRTQSRVRPLLEKLIQAAPATSRGTVTNAAQTFTAGDPLLGQATSAVQALVGPQAWESARGRIPEGAK
jgi:hypothetical protein